MLERWLLLKQIPLAPNFGRLFLPVFAFFMLFLDHGLASLTTFGVMAQNFLDPFHMGSMPSLVIATIADCVCSMLLFVGLFTRLAGLYAFSVYLVALLFVEHFKFFNTMNSNGGGRGGGDTLLMFMGSALALFFMGAGKYSLDAKFNLDAGEAK